MAEPARRQEPVDEALELDPAAVQRAYQLHRARRRAHRNRERETKRANLRFWLVLLALVVRQRLPEHRHLAPDPADVRPLGEYLHRGSVRALSA